MAMVFIFTIMVMVVSAYYGEAMNEVEDAAASPPTTMESTGFHHSASASLAVIALLLGWFHLDML